MPEFNMNLKILYLGKKIQKPQGGADQVNLRNQKMLETITNGNLDYVEPIGNSILDKLFLGVNKDFIRKVQAVIDKTEYDYVFVSQSLLGRIVRLIKKHKPNLKVITFFHNIEVDYARAYYKTAGIKALPFFWATKYWERIACKYTDIFITLNCRDSKLLRNRYGVDSNLELPTSFEDKFDEVKFSQCNVETQPIIDYLFVGVSFFANNHGVQWFIDNVMPNVMGDFYVIGKGMDQVQFKNLNDRIHILGFVDDLSEYYYRARFVVSPIFEGGGMKTKTAEALMYGKTILGTTEAFEGYEMDINSTILCNSKEEFVNAINNTISVKLNQSSRKLYLENYSNAVLQSRLQTLL